MKIKIATILLVFSLKIFSQAPALINYQGIVRDDKGQPVINQAIAIQFEILIGSASGGTIYVDPQPTGLQTNIFGLFSTQIGKNGNLGQVNWQPNQSYYLRILIDPTGGSNLVPLGNPQEIVSVPYALHAASVPATYSNSILSIGNKTFDITPSMTVTPNTSITASGMGTVTSTGTNSFDISIPPPTFSNTGQTIISGSYPNYIVSTPTVPAAVTPTISITNTNAATSTVVSSGSSFSINMPPPTFSNTGQTIVTGVYPNYVVNTPTVAATTIAITATAAAGPSVSASGSSFNINVPPATFTNAGPTTITGTSPNFTVNSAPVVTYTNGTGISITSGSVISNTAPNITPTVAITTSVAPIPSVSSVGSFFNINFPPAQIALSATAAAGPSVSSVGTSYSLNFPPPVIAVSSTAAAGPSVSTSGNNFNINIPSATTPSMYAAGIASVSPATGYNFTVSVDQPTFAYSQSNGSLTSGTSAAFITPTLAFSGTTLSSGPATNSIDLSTLSPWAAAGSSVALTNTANFVGIGTTSPAFKLDILGTSGPRLRVFSQDALFAGLLAKNSTHEYFAGIQADYESAGGVTSGFHIYDNTAGAQRMVIDATGKMGVANSAPQHQLSVGDATSDTQIFGLRVYQATSTNVNNWLGAAAFGGTTAAVVAGEIADVATIGGHSSNLNTWTDLSINPIGGNVGIGTSAPHAALQFSNSIQNRRIVLWEGANNEHQFYGFGINGSMLRYQTDSPGADHVFFAGTSAATSQELFRIKGNGLIKMGSETGTGQPPNYPTGGNGGGMLMRRLYTTNVTAGEIVARTPEIILERDGSYGGWRINNTGTSALSVCNCVGTNSSGAAVNVALNNIVSGTTTIYSNAQNIVYFRCMFGDPYYSLNGHITEVSLTRQATDFFWMGTVTSTFNQ